MSGFPAVTRSFYLVGNFVLAWEECEAFFEVPLAALFYLIGNCVVRRMHSQVRCANLQASRRDAFLC